MNWKIGLTVIVLLPPPDPTMRAREFELALQVFDDQNRRSAKLFRAESPRFGERPYLREGNRL